MGIVYPKDGHVTYENSTFLIGQAAGSARVQINDEAVRVSESGFFAHKVALTPGENRFSLSIDGEVLQSLRITSQPVNQDPGELVLLSPVEPLAVMAGDEVVFRCGGPAGLAPELLLEGDEGLKLRQFLVAVGDTGFQENVFGEVHSVRPGWPQVYEARIRLPRAMSGTVSGRIVAGQYQRDLSVTLWSQRRGIRVTTEKSLLRVAPDDGAHRLTPQPAGVRGEVDRREGEWLRLLLDSGQRGWIRLGDVEMLPDEALVTEIPLKAVVPIANGFRAHGADVPVLLKSRMGGQLVIHQFHGAHWACPVLRQPEGLYLNFLEGTTDAVLEAGVSSICGYDYGIDDSGYWFRYKSLPQELPWWRILIDPGHGGEETGTTGPNGLTEKELNLSVALALRDALKEQGFVNVSLTRTDDVAVSLEDRAKQAQDAHIVLSIHHNALPDGREPWEHQGMSVYYYHGMARRLARHFQHSLPQMLGRPDYGLFWDSLAMTRIHTGLAVLLELGFFTHPEEFEWLNRPDYPAQAAAAMAKALRQFCK